MNALQHPLPGFGPRIETPVAASATVEQLARLDFLARLNAIRAADREQDQRDEQALSVSPELAKFRRALVVTRYDFIGPVIPEALAEMPAPVAPVEHDERERVFVPRSDCCVGPLGPVLPGKSYLFRRGDADETPTPPVDEAPDVKFLTRCEEVYHAICADETGRSDDANAIEERLDARATLKAQSHEIARRLLEAGVEAYRNELASLWVYHVHTKTAEVLPKFRRICLLPYVAAMVRGAHLRALEYWLQRHPFCRFWTFTSGRRCHVHELRERLTKLHAGLSDLNAYLKRRGYPVEIVFRSSELGTVETKRGVVGNDGVERMGHTDETGGEAGSIGRDAQGEALYHPHAHCVVWLKNGRLDTWRWDALLNEVWDFWEAHWGQRTNWQDGDDKGGPIRNPREVVKYVFKPGEIFALQPHELADLHEALHRVKLVQPMGELRRELAAREKARLTLVKQRTPDGAVWREVVDWNRHLPKDDEEKMLERAHRLDRKEVDFCNVVARLVPAIGPLGVSEPRVVVIGSRWDPEAVASHPLVRRIVEHTREKFTASLIRVHTGTPTVTGRERLGFWPDVEERTRPPGPPVFEAYHAENSVCGGKN